ncbi:DUF4382 domain-containing protein [Aurantivibrio plasticivorans]
MMKYVPSVLAVSCVGVLLAGCGGSGGSDSGSSGTDVSLSFSDAPVQDAQEVVITVDTITFNRSGEDDIVVDTFTSDELGIEDADTFTLDLLDYQGADSVLVLDSVKLPVGEYSNLRLGILDENLAFSYVVVGGNAYEIKVPSDELKLGGFTVSETTTQNFVVEFDLTRALAHNPTPERYILKPHGVRVVDLQEAATLQGTVDFDALHAITPCDTKPVQTVDNIAYLYQGHDLDTNLLGDVFVRGPEPGELVNGEPSVPDVDYDSDVPADIIAPYGSSIIDNSEVSYIFSYVEPGDYTLAISCEATDDNPILWDEIPVPSPVLQVVELTLAEGETESCDFPLADGVCAP